MPVRSQRLSSDISEQLDEIIGFGIRRINHF